MFNNIAQNSGVMRKNIGTSTWATDKILRSALASKITYKYDSSKMKLLHGRDKCGDECKIIEVADKSWPTYAYIWRTGETSALVAFRGSRGYKDLLHLASTSFQSIDFHGFEVHKATYDIFDNVKDQLTDYFDKTGVQNITFSGHSAGASIAKLASVHFKLENPKYNISAHLFGAPQIGYSDFNTWTYNTLDEIYEIANRNDPVCNICLIGKPLFTDSATVNDFIVIGDEVIHNKDTFLIAHNLDTYISNIVLNIYFEYEPKLPTKSSL